MKIELKSCTANDVEELQKLARAAFHQTFAAQNPAKDMQHYLEHDYSLPVLTDELKDPNALVLFLYYDGKLAGYTKLNVGSAQTEPMGDDTLEVQRIYLLKDFHRLGLGTKMIKYAIKVAQNKHKHAIWLGVWDQNERAKKFYQAMGFKPVGTHKFKLGRQIQRHFVMKMTLN